MNVTIRFATERDVPFLAEIERAAGCLFLHTDMREIADDDPIPEDELRQAMHAGLLLVADPDVEDGQPVAYLLAKTLRDSLHIEQVTVHPTHARQGIGARLIEACGESARELERGDLTLTTFRDIPWNAPYYRRLGFVDVPADDVAPDLMAIIEQERDAGYHRWPRVVMRRACDQPDDVGEVDSKTPRAVRLAGSEPGRFAPMGEREGDSAFRKNGSEKPNALRL